MGTARFDRQELFNGLIRILEDAGRLEITKFDLEVLGHGDWSQVSEALIEWEKRDFLQIVQDPRDANSNDICVRMFSIHRNKKWPDCL